jgi:hypothetical protein
VGYLADDAHKANIYITGGFSQADGPWWYAKAYI